MNWWYANDKESVMEFDKSRVYTALNADELKKGDKVIMGDTLDYLRRKVADGKDVQILKDITDEQCTSRFIVATGFDCLAYLIERAENCTNCGNRGSSYCFCFTRDKSDAELSRTVCDNYIRLSEQKVEKKYRPFKDCDELIDYWYDKTGMRHPDGLIYGVSSLTMPLIWVRRKEGNSKGQLITEFSDSLWVGMGKEAYNMTDLLVHFTFLDGSPCGVEE